MKLRRAPLLTIAAVALVAIGLAACGGSSNSDNNDNASAATSGSGGGQTISTKSVSGVGTVLVDSSGMALYTNDQDSTTNVMCTGSCAGIWMPLMAPSNGQPTSSDQAVQAKLGVTKSKNGSQVTFGGKPLYTFAQDGPGQVTGNGLTDNFGGTSFSWTVASNGQVSTGSSGTTTSDSGSSAGGYGSGGSSSSGGY